MTKKAFVILLCMLFSCAAFANTCESELSGNVASYLRLLKESMRSTGSHSPVVSNSQLERMTAENMDPLSFAIADSTNAAAKAAFARLASSLSFEQRQQVLVEVARLLQDSHSSQQIIQKARDFTAPVLAPQAFEAIDLKGNFGKVKPGGLRLHKNVDGKIWVVLYSMPNGRWATGLSIFSFDNLQSQAFTHQKIDLRNERSELYGDSFGNLWMASYAGTRLNLQNLSTNESLPEHNVQLPIQEVIPFRDLTGSMRLATVQKTNRRDIDEYQLEILKVDAGFESQLVIPFESGMHEFSKTPSGETLVTVISPKRKLQVWNLTTLSLVTEWDYRRAIFVGTKTFASRQGQIHVAVKDYRDDGPTLFFKSGERDPIMALGWDWTSKVDWYEANNGRLFAILTAESEGKPQDKSAKLRLFEPFNPATQQIYKNRFDRVVNFLGFDSGASRLQTNPLHEVQLRGGRQSFGIHRHSAGRLLLTRGSNDFRAFTIDEQKGELVSAFQFNRDSNRNDYFVTKFSAKNGRLYGAYNFENNKIAVSEFSTDGMSSTNQVVFATRGAWALIDDGDQIYVANLIGSKLQFATILGRAE